MFKTLSEVINVNKFFFEPGAMRFFKSKIESELKPNQTFLTSEQPPYGNRKFNIRLAIGPKDIETIGEFCSYITKYRAEKIQNSIPLKAVDAILLLRKAWGEDDPKMFLNSCNSNADKDSLEFACNFFLENRELLGTEIFNDVLDNKKTKVS